MRKLIPFKFELYQAGYKAKFKISENNVIHVYPRSCKDFPILVVWEEDGCYESSMFDEDGGEYGDEEYIMLEKEIEETTFYVNVYPTHYRAYESQLKADLNAFDRKGRLKVTYTEEDLIK